MISQILFEMLDDEKVSFSDVCRVTLAPDPTVKDRWFITITYLYQEYDEEKNKGDGQTGQDTPIHQGD